MLKPHLWVAATWGLVIAGFTAAVLATVLSESLWLDELHTSWSVAGAASNTEASGHWRAIAERAAAGNQAPLYFWLIGVLDLTLGQHPDWILRLPSMLAWLLTLGMVMFILHDQLELRAASRTWFTLGVLTWIVLDRQQWFYASEARPYAFVQLFSLAGWFCIQRLLLPNQSVWRSGSLMAFWCLMAIANIYTHLTAALPVLCQWLIGGCLLGRVHYRSLRGLQRAAPELPSAAALGLAWAAAAGIIALAVLPMWQLAAPVWQRRKQWTAFASDVSLSHAIGMFPFVPILGCALLAIALQKLWPDGKASHAVGGARVPDVTRVMWWSAMLGPWLVAWSITAMGIAPLFHKRFILASALPLVIVAAIELLKLSHRGLRWLAVGGIAVALLFTQGTSAVWRQGTLVGALRGEDWRAATLWIGQRIESGEPLLCASGLIEADEVQLPLNNAFAEYLSFPLGGVYTVRDRNDQPIVVTPLVNAAQHWSTQLRARLSEQTVAPNRIWLVYRGTRLRLAEKLKILLRDLTDKSLLLEIGETRRFGNLYVVVLNTRAHAGADK